MRYHTAEAHAYLVVTGARIDDVLVKKKAMVWPFQKVTKISVTPFDFSIHLQAMTHEKLKFSLPAVFTIGPEDTPESLQKYAKLLTGQSDGLPATDANGVVSTGHDHVQAIVKGVIEGETRSIVSTMSMEQLFGDRQGFKDKVIEHVHKELKQFGLRVYNANVKELQDTAGSEYFTVLSRKAHEGAPNQAKVDVASARMKGEIGEAEMQGQTKQRIAEINAKTAVKETERKSEKAVADANLEQKSISIEQSLNLARIEAKRAGEQRDTELQKTLEVKRAEMELERQRATKVTQARIDRESAQQRADAALYTKEKDTDAATYAMAKNADADKYLSQTRAEAKLYSQQQDAEAKRFAEQQGAQARLYVNQQDAEASFIATKRAAEAAQEAKQTEAQARLYTQQQDAEADFIKKQRAAEAYLLTKTGEADALLLTRQKEGEAHLEMEQKKAEAYLAKKQKEAQAHLVMRQSEAEGQLAMLKAEAAGRIEMAKAYQALSNALGGPQGLLQYMMIERGMYEALGESQAKAVQGVQPKINVWNTGSQAEGAPDSMAPIRNLFQTLPPMLSTIQDQTGIAPPSWFAQMPKGEGDGSEQQGQQQAQQRQRQKLLEEKGFAGVNGTK